MEPRTTCPRRPSEAEPTTSTSASDASTASSRPPDTERCATLWKVTSIPAPIFSR
ncbi:Uncharacterised protein [Mycobacteroides abscessus subsp. abscessus]|nr:Uncharacterised protein [Mycobacteroides abscessus subsp. abscessus]